MALVNAKVRKRPHYTPAEVAILLLFSVLLCFAACTIQFQSSEKILSFLKRRASAEKKKRLLPKRLSLERLVTMLEAADCRFSRKTSCLRRALVLTWVLNWLGQDSKIQARIGVRRTGEDLEAHTWLEYQEIPLESPPHDFFQPLQRQEES